MIYVCPWCGDSIPNEIYILDHSILHVETPYPPPEPEIVPERILSFDELADKGYLMAAIDEEFPNDH